MQDILNIPSEAILRLKTVLQRTGLSRTMLYEQIADGTFPRPIGIGKRAVGWAESEIAAWIEARVKTRTFAR